MPDRWGVKSVIPDDNSVNSAKIQDNSVTSAKIQDDSITNADIANIPQGAIANPTGGLTSDAEARATIGNILTALRNAGIINP